MAFGSLVIAICQLIRAVLYAIASSTKKAQEGNVVLKLTIKCTLCAMWCLEKTIEFVSYYAFIYVALEGSDFCKSCKSTFSLVIQHPAQAAVNQMVKMMIRVLMGYSTPCLVAWFSWMALDNDVAFSQEFTPLYSSVAVF